MAQLAAEPRGLLMRQLHQLPTRLNHAVRLRIYDSGRHGERSSPLRYNKPSLLNDGFVLGLEP